MMNSAQPSQIVSMLGLRDNTHESDDEWSGSEEFSSTRLNGKTNDAQPFSLPEESKSAKLAKTETRAVRVLRVITLLVMVGAALFVSVLLYRYMKGEEEMELHQTFHDLANRLMVGLHANAALRVQVLDMLAISLTSTAIATNQTWPFVTLDDFEARATAARAIVKSEYLGMYVYVTDETRKEWEHYTTQNTHWLNESYVYQDYFKSVHGRTVGSRAPARRALRTMSVDDADADMLSRWLQENQDITTAFHNVTFDGPDGITTEIYRFGSEEEGVLWAWDEGPGPYYPMWHVSPTREFAAIDINYNCADKNYQLHWMPETVRTTQMPLISSVYNVDETGYINEDDDYDFRTVPASSVMFPIFDKVMGNKEVVAVLDMDVEFGTLFASILPSNSQPLMCVVDSSCGQVFSYEVTGGMSTYLDAEDLHDPNLEHMMLSTLLADIEDAGVLYNGPPINQDIKFCPWVINIYATQEMVDAYITFQPVYYMLAVLGVFLFTCLVFCLYDWLVEHRQRKVARIAKKSDKIVSDLFPKDFRDKLYGNSTDKSKEARVERTPKSFQTSPVEESLVESRGPNAPLNHMDPPMAKLYLNCTVFFGDIVGFTAWSSVRNPAQVFTLLETLYGAFDKLAHKHKVFKIETIGDCYVAVTGLPVPQPNHAVQMVRFSRDVHSKMKKLTQWLEGPLGPDTALLAMRIGLNSGPVTAGILRGEKARFQLFGDTVNTTARMESNGQREQIHVSQQTADILTVQGKGDWLEARQEKIHAKGKGEIQTYFLKMSCAKSELSALSSASVDSHQYGRMVSEDETYDV